MAIPFMSEIILLRLKPWAGGGDVAGGAVWVLALGQVVDWAAVAAIAAGVGGAAADSGGFSDGVDGVVGVPGEPAEAAVAGGSEPTGKQKISSPSRDADCFAFSSTK
jgi:hypothetical protein